MTGAQVLLGALLLLLPGLPGWAAAQTVPAAEDTAPRGAPPRPAQRGFASPEAAVEALLVTLRAGRGAGPLIAILGEAAGPLIRSDDPAADRALRDRFLAAYDERHDIRRPAPGRAVLTVGADDWPFPFPIRERGGVWRFDARAGAQEILDRRIGRNELDAIEVVRAIGDAQHDYAAAPRDGQPVRAYARRLLSAPGRQDGLYWPTGPGGPESPLGPLVAEATAGDYRRAAEGRPQPYRGYVFRLLDGQGPAAAGGAYDYVVNGRMIGGFGVVAFPARYRETGIKTFIMNHDGVVFERDLGPETPRLARAMRRFDPGAGWTRVVGTQP